MRFFRKHIAKTTAQIQWVQRLLREVVKPVVRELRKKQRESPGNWSRLSSVSRSMTCVSRAALWFLENRGQKQGSLPQDHPNGTSLAFKKHHIAPAQLPWQPQCSDS